MIHLGGDKESSGMPDNKRRQVVIVGGGLSGLAAAEALSYEQEAVDIVLLEARRSTGGRAGSFYDAVTGESIDYCQHVAMGCCTNLIEMLERNQLLQFWDRYTELDFRCPGYAPSRFAPSKWLPAPLHLASSLSSLNYLSGRQKREIKRAIWALMRTSESDLEDKTALQWLAEQRQSATSIKRFWDVILISALGERTEVVSMAAARKVIIDGFAASQGASDVLVPSLPLSTLFGELLPGRLKSGGVTIRCQTSVSAIESFESSSGSQATLTLADGTNLSADDVICAVPWFRLKSIVGAMGQCEPREASVGRSADAEVSLDEIDSLPSSPITGIHLWFDRPVMNQPHAVLVGTLAQWVFRDPIKRKSPIKQTSIADDQSHAVNEPAVKKLSEANEHYVQVVISAASRDESVSRSDLVDAVVEELRDEFPEASNAKLLRSRVVTDPNSVFSVSPASERLRSNIHPTLPCCRHPWLHLAGDWVKTGWPATMEGAVISGRLAAQQVLERCGKQGAAVAPGLPTGLLARLLVRS